MFPGLILEACLWFPGWYFLIQHHLGLSPAKPALLSVLPLLCQSVLTSKSLCALSSPCEEDIVDCSKKMAFLRTLRLVWHIELFPLPPFSVCHINPLCLQSTFILESEYEPWRGCDHSPSLSPLQCPLQCATCLLSPIVAFQEVYKSCFLACSA